MPDMPEATNREYPLTHKETVESYEFRSVSIEEERTDMVKEDILQAVKEMGG